MLTKADANLIHALKTRRGREKHGLFAAEGIRVVEDMVTSGSDLEFAVVATSLGDSRRGAALLAALEAATKVHRIPEHQLDQIAETETPQGVLVVSRIPATALGDVAPSDAALVLVLDAIQDPGNLGTLIRSADAFGAAAVIALPGTTDFWSSKVIRAAAGSTFRTPLISADETSVWSWLQQQEFNIFGADMEGVSVTEAQLTGRAALVVGNEGGGLRADTRGHLTQTLSIPMRGAAESLNVAVAAGILLYEFSRQRR